MISEYHLLKMLSKLAATRIVHVRVISARFEPGEGEGVIGLPGFFSHLKKKKISVLLLAQDLI